MKFSSVFIALSSFLISLNSYAANINFIETDDIKPNSGVISLYGEIKNYDAPQFVNLVEVLKKSNKEILGIDLNSNGGNVVAAIEIMNHILGHKLNTVVRNGNSCGSACFLIFMAGNHRYAEPDARLFVHRISVDNTDTLEAKGFSVEMNTIYRQLNVPSNLRIAMLETPPDQIYVLDKKDIDVINSGFEQREIDKIRSNNEALNPDSDDDDDLDEVLNPNVDSNQNESSNDIRTGVYATDAYYNSLAKYNTSSLSFEQAVKKLERVAINDSTGVPEYLIGKMYQDGLSGKKENGKAWTYYEMAAKKGNGLAIFRMGVYFHINKKDEEALAFIIQALKMSVPNAINYAGYMSEKGIIIPQNLTEARQFYELGASMGNEQSPYALGMLYLNGVGVSKDLGKACKLFRLAYSRGNIKAYEVTKDMCN